MSRKLCPHGCIGSSQMPQMNQAIVDSSGHVLAVGAGGPGMILSSGELSSDIAIIGFEGGATNFVSILGSAAVGRR